MNMKGSEILGIVALILLLVGLPSYFAFINSMSTSYENNDIDSTVENTSNFIVEYSLGEIASGVIIGIFSAVISILVALGFLKKGLK